MGFKDIKKHAPMAGDEAESVDSPAEDRAEGESPKKGGGMKNHAKGCDCKMCKG